MEDHNNEKRPRQQGRSNYTRRAPMRIEQLSGTPTDCVKMALNLFNDRSFHS